MAKPKKEKRGFLSKLFNKTKKTDATLTLANTFKGFQANFVNYNNSILESDLILSATRLKSRFFGKLMPRHVRDNASQMINVNDSSVARLLRQPNEYQTPYDFLSQAYFLRELHDNCYIYPKYYISNAGEKIYEAMYILIPQQKPYIYEDDKGNLLIKFIFPSYNEPVIFYLNDLIIWKKNYEDDQFLGGGRYTSAANADALSSLNAYAAIKESTANVAEQGGAFDGLLKVNGFASDLEKIQTIRDNFVNDLKNNKNGLPVLDNGAEYINIARQLKTIDAATMKEIKENLFIHTGVTLEMLMGNFDTKSKEALYENWIEPAAISLGQAMSKCFFSQWQTTHGDQILLYPNKVQLMATTEIVSIIQSTISAGVFKIDEYREMLGYAPLENAEGQVRPRGYNNLDGSQKIVDEAPAPAVSDNTLPTPQLNARPTEINITYRFNENHDPKTGQFTDGHGGSGGGSKGKTDSSKPKTVSYGGKEYKQMTDEQYKDGEDFVKGGLSNEVKPFNREQEPNMQKIKDRGGLDDEGAKQAVALAERVNAKADENEPQITSDVVASANDAGATMFGLDFRKKQTTSMAGKFGEDAKTDGITLEEAATGIKDAVRYTAVLDEDNFTSGYNKIKATMEAKGYKEVRCKNFYEMYESGSSCQKAVQCVYQNKDGYNFELQFHTVSSLAVKEKYNHKLYETMREATTPQDIKNGLNELMVDSGKRVSNPKDVLTIKSHK